MFWQKHLSHNLSAQKFKKQMAVVAMVVSIWNVTLFRKSYIFQFFRTLIAQT